MNRFTALCALWIAMASAAPVSQAATVKSANDEAYAIGAEAYTFLYPLVTMEITRRVATNSAPGAMVGRGPMNTVVNLREFPSVDFRDVVRPNFDTLYSIIWFDVSKEPMVLSVGDTNGRYYLLPILDMWTNAFAVPGKRTSGTAAKNFLIVKRGWRGKVPKNVELITSPTSVNWMIGRIQTNGPADYPAVHVVQDSLKIVPLSEWNGGKSNPVVFSPDPSIDMKTPPLDQVNALSATDFFKLASELLKANPPQATDWSTLERMKKIGFVAGKTYDLGAQPADIQAAVAQGAKDVRANIVQKIPSIAKVVNGWQMNTDTMGVYGNFYLKRAIVAMVGLGANQPEDAIYPMAVTDSKGDKLVGNQNYVLHFAKDQLPPVGAFWSVTMYDAQGFQVANELNRYAIGDRDALKFNADGSLDLYFQHTNPGGDRTSNWLPSPASGELGITMRLYAPAPQVLDGRWNPPAIVKN